tara:strand:+ start:278 stop:637 length:360 start_codon:yes stop_codon:yes gene_type:complete
MLSQVLVNNRVGVKGEISTIKNSDGIWTHNEALSKWIEKYPNRDISEFHRNYSLIIIKDKPVDELIYLVAPVMDGDNPVGSAYHFIEPNSASPEWQELFTTGQITKTFAEIEPYLEAFK